MIEIRCAACNCLFVKLGGVWCCPSCYTEIRDPDDDLAEWTKAFDRKFLRSLQIAPDDDPLKSD